MKRLGRKIQSHPEGGNLGDFSLINLHRLWTDLYPIEDSRHQNGFPPEEPPVPLSHCIDLRPIKDCGGLLPDVAPEPTSMFLELHPLEYSSASEVPPFLAKVTPYLNEKYHTCLMGTRGIASSSSQGPGASLWQPTAPRCRLTGSQPNPLNSQIMISYNVIIITAHSSYSIVQPRGIILSTPYNNTAFLIKVRCGGQCKHTQIRGRATVVVTGR